MEVRKEDSISVIAERFTSIFPLLSLRFYSRKHSRFEGSPEAIELEEHYLLVDLNPRMRDGNIILANDITVSNLEFQFEKEFGLYVQVFRKSGDQWVQTITTDNWSLRKQQEKAQEMEDFANSK